MANLGWIGKRPVDLVIVTGEMPEALEPWVREGGRLIIASLAAPPFPVAETVRLMKSDAHPLVAMTLMCQGNRQLVHFVNLSGHSQTGYFDPIPIRDVGVQVKAPFRSARAVRAGKDLAVSRQGEYASFELPSLGDYELVELH